MTSWGCTVRPLIAVTDLPRCSSPNSCGSDSQGAWGVMQADNSSKWRGGEKSTVMRASKRACEVVTDPHS